MPRPRTEIWNFFEEEVTQSEAGERVVQAKCKLCPAVVKVADHNTSGMRSHLFRKHPFEFAQIELDKSEKKRKADVAFNEFEQIYDEDESYEKDHGDKVPLVMDRRVKSRKLGSPSKGNQNKKIDAWLKYKPQDRDQLRGDLEIAKFLARCNLPFSLVGHKGFQDLIAYFNPKMLIKSATTYSRYKLPLVYKNVKAAVDQVLEKDLPKSPGFVISSDMWQSRNNDAYQAITLHLINEDFNHRMFVIGVSPFSGRHTAEAIANRLDQNVSEIPGNVGHSYVVCVHDSASNLRAAIPKCKFVDESLLCADHLLKLVVEGAIKEAKSVEGLDLESAIKKATELSSLCHKSSLSEKRIKKEIQNMLDDNDTVDKKELKYVKIISPVKTRWNSTLMMIDSIVRVRRPLSSIRDNPGSDPNKFAPAIPSEDAIVFYKRTKLQPEQVEKLLYIQQNYVKVKIKKSLLTSAEEQAYEAAAVEGPASPSPAASRASTPNVVDLTVEDNY